MYFSRVIVKPDIRELSRLHQLLRNNGYGAHQMLWGLFPGEKKRAYLFREEITNEQIPYYRGVRGEPIYYIVSRNEPTKENPLFNIESKPYKPKLVTGDRLSFKLRANPVQLAKKERPSSEIEAWRRSREQRSLKEKQPTKKRIRNDVVMEAQYRLLRDLADCAMVEAIGGKSQLKQRVLSSWVGSNNQDIIAMLKRTLEQNERYREFLEQKISPSKLFHLAFKAAIDLSLETWLIEKGKTRGFKVVQDEKKKRLMFQAEGYRWHSLPKKGRTAGFSSVDFEGELEVTDPASFIEALFTGVGPAKAFGCGLMLVRRI